MRFNSDRKYSLRQHEEGTLRGTTLIREAIIFCIEYKSLILILSFCVTLDIAIVNHYSFRILRYKVNDFIEKIFIMYIRILF